MEVYLDLVSSLKKVFVRRKVQFSHATRCRSGPQNIQTFVDIFGKKIEWTLSFENYVHFI